MSSQVVKDYLSNQSKINNSATKQSTYVDGDTGYVDFEDNQFSEGHALNLSNEQSSLHAASPDPLEREGSLDDLSQDAGPMDKVTPKLPHKQHHIGSVAGKKHSRDGNIIENMHDETPKGLTDMFGSNKKAGQQIGMTQLFENTQAGTSSPTSPSNVKSDPIFARPSPAMRTLHRSTPTLETSSSPPLARKPATSLVFEPRDTYTPLDESQRLRLEGEAQDRNEIMSMNSADEEELELSDDPEYRRREQRRKRQQIDQQALRAFSSFAAPAPRQRDNSRKPFAAQTVIGLVTPQVNGKKVITISSDSKVDEANRSDKEGSVDEYDEFSQSVLTTNYKTPKTRPEATSSMNALTSKRFARGRPNSSPVPGRYAANKLQQRSKNSFGRTEQPSAQNCNIDDDVRTPNMQARNYVENSQPDHRLKNFGPPPRPILPSSVTSQGFVSQSQLPSGSSRGHGLLDDDLGDSPNIETSSIPAAPALRDSSDGPGDVDGRSQTPASSPPRLESKRVAGEGTAKVVDREFPNANPNPERNQTGGSEREETDEATDKRKENRPPINSIDQSRDHRSASAIPETSPMVIIDNQQLSHNTTTNVEGSTKVSELANRGNEPPVTTTPASPSTQRSAFQTAPSHHSSNAARSDVQGSDSANKSATPASMSRHGIKKMVDIAAQSSPSAPSNTMNFDELSLLTEEDRNYHRLVFGDSPNTRSRKQSGVTYSTRIARTRNNRASQDSTQPLPNQQRNKLQETFTSSEAQGALPPKNTAKLSRILNTKKSSRHLRGKQAHVEARDVASRENRSMSGDELADGPPQVEAAGSNPKYSRSHKEPMQPRVGSKNITSEKVRSGLDTSTENLKDSHKAATAPQSFPNRVFAMFKGLTHSFCPATVTGPASSSSTALQVCFDDGSVDLIEQHLIKRLELRVGDLVKVNIPGKKNTVFVVQKLSDNLRQLPAGNENDGAHDVYGNQSVMLQPKQRASLPLDEAGNAKGCIKAPIADIYITNNLWSRLKDREYSSNTISRKGIAMHDPVRDKHMPGTPSSRTRQKPTTAAPPPKPTFSSKTKSSEEKGGVFRNMAFAISFSTDKEDDKARVINLILEEGGQILQDGFEQLCELQTSNSNPSLKSSSRNSLDNSSALDLSASARKLGFVALISDSHSRRTKYMQALALNIPCLHSHWILDSAKQNSVQPWPKYLLPAGDSQFLGGATRSRVIHGLPAASLTHATDLELKDMFTNRARFLQGKRVILVIGNGKIGERRTVYTFLTAAANAKEMKVVKDVPSARLAIEENNGWDLVVVEDARVTDARHKLLGTRKSIKRDAKAKDTRTVRDGDGIAVVGDESILQSLILGSWIG